jgi:hypothetical protein
MVRRQRATAGRARANSVDVAPGNPGQYGSLPTPARPELEKTIRDKVRDKGKAVGIANGNILDTEIDGYLDVWREEIRAEFHRRSEIIEAELIDAQSALDTATRELKPHEETYGHARASYKVAYKAHTGRDADDDATTSDERASGRPGGAADGQVGGHAGSAPGTDLAVRSTAPPVSPPGPAPVYTSHRRYPYHGELGRHTVGESLHYVVLAVAALADFVAFYQVLALVLGSLPEMLYLVVLAVTMFALWLMHQTGKTLRDFRVRDGDSRPWIGIVCFLTWVALGTGAYLLRVVVKDSTGIGDALTGFGGQTTGTNDAAVTTKALVFLIIFVTTGMVALIGAYLTWNPYRKRYRKELRALRKAEKAREQARRAVDDARRRRDQAQQRKTGEHELRDTILQHREKLACWLKEITRQEIAIVLQDPDATKFLLSQPIPGCRPAPDTGRTIDAR